MVQNRRLDDEIRASNFGRRHLQCLLLFFSLLVAFTTRVNMSVAVVAMTSSHNSTATLSNSTADDQPEYNWSERTKSYVLSSFFWGYFITQIPGGHLAQKYGGRYLMLQAIFITSILTLCTPYAVKMGNWQCLCIFRLIQGLSQGALFPTIHTILSKWAPVEERNSLGTYCYIGSKFGTVSMMASSGVLVTKFGWESIFYASGGVCFMWSVAWFIWGASTPADCKSITVAERTLIETSLSATMKIEQGKRALKTPWSKIFTSVPFLVLNCVHSAHGWGFWTLLTQTPTYMKSVFNVNIKSNAMYSALPYVAFILLGFAFCRFDSWLQKRKCLSLLAARRMFTTISLWIPAISLMCLGYVTNVTMAVIVLTITTGFNSAYFVGWNMNHIELSPNYAGIIMGISNCIGNIVALLAPLYVGFVVEDEHNPHQWRIVFFTAGILYFIANSLFISFGSVKVQPWNEPPVKNQELKFIRVATSPEDNKN